MGAEVDELRHALAQGGCTAMGPLMEELGRALTPPADHEREVREAMELLRSYRCFAALDRLAVALAEECPPGSLNILIRRQLGQAKVDRGLLDEALGVLNPLSDEVQARGSRQDRSEVVGLIGRAYKQQFVKAVDAGQNGAAELRAAIASHASVFKLNPSWHGANLVALSARAERDGIPIDGDKAAVWARRLLRDLDARGRTSWGPWDFAAAGEAWLALHDYERSAEHFRNYWSSPNVDAFALGGTARQLREIWQAGSDPFLWSLLMQFESRSLRRPGGRVEWSPGDLRERAAGIDRDLADKNRAEALFGRGSTIPLEKLLQLIGYAGSICRIYDRKSGAGGATGFLVDGTRFGLPAGPLLLTNHHVLHGSEADDKLLASPDYGGCIRQDHAQARFTYWGGTTTGREFAIKEILDHSPRPDIDFTLASLEGTVPPGMALPICVDDKPLRSRNVTDPRQRSKVVVVGHPRGEALTFSLDDTEVVDHELDGNRCPGPRRIHYRTSTDHGNSGSPVFESDTLEVVGLHRSGRVGPLRPEWPRKQPDDIYEANEAVWIGSISEYARRLK